jgi:16S rRNA (guanine(966)-N(2))-methyltransferase RsmD
MRIIGGMAAGAILQAPKGLDVRPTPDLVKQALFNSLGERIVGKRVLELFAGTGALGLECLSRGAVHLVSVEKSARHADFIRRNHQGVKLGKDTLEVRVQDAFVILGQFRAIPRQFEIIVADPPYGPKNINCRSESLAQKLLDAPDLPHLLTPDGLLILGHARRDTLSIPDSWEEKKLLRHGDSIMRFFRKRAEDIQGSSGQSPQGLPQS